MSHGRFFMGSHDGGEHDTARDLDTARQHFLYAHYVLVKLHCVDPTQLLEVYYDLVTVELNSTFRRALSVEKRQKHLRYAMTYCESAVGVARSGRAVPADLAHATLRKAVLQGRKSELAARAGMDPREVRQSKEKAVVDITLALQEMEKVDNASMEVSKAWGYSWRDRLSGART